MIGFSIMMWFCSALLIFVSFSLLKGNYSSVHGKVFETTNDRKGYAKALGKPVLLIGICLLFSGCILQSPADSDAFQSGRCAKHNGRPETMYF